MKKAQNGNYHTKQENKDMIKILYKKKKMNKIKYKQMIVVYLMIVIT